MRTTAHLGTLIAAALLLTSCRDEQAGPRNRPIPSSATRSPRTLDAPPQDLTFRSGATWAEGSIRYLGTRVDPPEPQPGQRVRLTHYLQALKAPPSGWRFFVHLVDPSTGTMLVNADHEFGGGAMPLENWPVGKIVEDQHELSAPPGTSRVMLGFWKGDSRLGIDQPQARDAVSRMIGPTIGGASAAAAEDVPEYRVKRTPTPPVIDGDLSDPVWRNATEVTLVGSMNGEKPRLRTTARLLYDDKNLYVAFDAEDPDVWGTLMNRDDPIYGQEVVEIFLDANADMKTYNELEVSPNNTIFDAYFPARRQGMDLTWDSKMRTGVKIRGTLNDPSDVDQGWSVEMAIPFATLAEVPRLPQPGDTWRFNLYRLDLPDRRRQEGQAFSPVRIPDFHNLPRFGKLIFE
jgi:hypothetical protein